MFINCKFKVSSNALNVRKIKKQKKQEIIQSAAFFDIDNTLIQGASIFYVVKKMYKRDIIKIKDAIWLTWKHLKFSILGENSSDINSVKNFVLNFFKGTLVKETKDISEKIYDETISSKIWSGAENLIKQHLKIGRKIWLATATPIEIAQVISKKLKLTGALGTVSEVIEGRYTGRLIGDMLHGPAKALAVKNLAQKENLNLKKCFAYSDSYNDIPFLSLVGNPVAINPDRKLKRYALQKNWLVYYFK